MDNNLEKLKQSYLKALNCLFIAADESVAQDVNQKVKAYVAALEQELEKVLGSPTLKLAAEVARARQAEINRLEDLLEDKKEVIRVLEAVVRSYEKLVLR
jgi:hypothetical protein